MARRPRSKLRPSGVSGKEWYLTLLKSLPKEVVKALEVELALSAEILRKEIENAAPEDSGALRKTVRSKKVSGTAADNDLWYRISAGGNANGEKVGYARLLEFGWSGGPAQPFFYPVYRSLKRRIRTRISRATNRGIVDAVKKQGTP